MIPALIGIGASFLLAAGGVIFAYGRNVQAMTMLTEHVKELRVSVANLLRRVGDAEGDIKAILRGQEVEQGLSGRVRFGPQGSDE